MKPVVVALLALSLLGGGCASPPASTIPPPPPISPCTAGPPIPTDEVPVRELFRVWELREAAATECRAKERAWREAWPR